MEQEVQTDDQNNGTQWLQGTSCTNSLKYMHTSFSSSMNVFLVLGLSRSVKASVPLATPPSVPDDSTTIPDSSREILKSVWRKSLNEHTIQNVHFVISLSKTAVAGALSHTKSAPTCKSVCLSHTTQLTLHIEESWCAQNSWWMQTSNVIQFPCWRTSSTTQTQFIKFNCTVRQWNYYLYAFRTVCWAQFKAPDCQHQFPSQVSQQ
jgi:hypothetical protein